MGISTLRSTLLASALIAVTATPAFAAEDPKAPAATPAAAPQDAAAAPADQTANSDGLADIVVLAADVFTNPPVKPGDVVVDTTIFDGRVVYERPRVGR